MEISEKDRIRAAKEMAQDQARNLGAELERDARSLVLVSGLVFDHEESDSVALEYEELAQSFVNARIQFHTEQRERFEAFADELAERLYGVDN
jgi:hypothetical protein